MPDDPSALRAVLDRMDGEVDLVVTSGGVSVGAYDVVMEVLAPIGVRFMRVAVQPWKPQGLGRLGRGTPVVCLPGNPVSVHVGVELFRRPTLRALLGHEELLRPTERAVIEDGWRTAADRAQYMPVLLGGSEGRRTRRARPGGSESHLVACLARADGLAEVPIEVDEVEPGAVLTVWRTDG